MSSSTPTGLRLSELTAQIEGVVNRSFPESFWVLADVTNHRYYPQKFRHFFDLVEKGDRGDQILAKVASVAWRHGHDRIHHFESETGQRFTNGINVLVRVKVEFNSLHGLKLILEDISPEYTFGKLKQQKEQILRQLETTCSDFIQKVGDEYVTRNSRMVLPPVIQRIAVVGSANSAGLEDFRHTLVANEFGYAFKIDEYLGRVQGPGGAKELCNRLLDVFNSQKPYDAVVILRGGGSQTDFLMFDQFIVGRIVAKFPIPIITGLGHQKDETIADLMAHLSTKTPTKAAEFIIARNRSFLEQITTFQHRICICAERLLRMQDRTLTEFNSRVVNTARTTLTKQKDEIGRCNRLIVQKTTSLLHKYQNEVQAAIHQATSKPMSLVAVKRSELTSASERLNTGCRLFLKTRRNYVGHFVSVINLARPEVIMKRGFAILMQGDQIVVDHSTINVGSRIKIVSATSQLAAKIESKTPRI